MKKGLERDLNGYKLIIKTSISKAEKAGSEMFSLYGTLLSEEKRLQWEGWVKDMTQNDPWTDLHGKAQEGNHRKMRDAFDDCVMRHVQY